MTDTIHFMITVITLLPLNKKVCSECLGGRRTHVWLILVELEGHFTHEHLSKRHVSFSCSQITVHMYRVSDCSVIQQNFDCKHGNYLIAYLGYSLNIKKCILNLQIFCCIIMSFSPHPKGQHCRGGHSFVPSSLA